MQETCFWGLVDMIPQWWQTTKPYYPPVIYDIAMLGTYELCQFIDVLYLGEWCFSIAMLNWQRVNNGKQPFNHRYTQISSRDPAPIETGSVEACCFARYSFGLQAVGTIPEPGKGAGAMFCWINHQPMVASALCKHTYMYVCRYVYIYIDYVSVFYA